MNTAVLILWCNLAIAFGASINHQPRGLSVKPSGQFAQGSDGLRYLKTRQVSPPVVAATDRIPTTIGSRSIKDAQVLQGAQLEDAPSQQDTSESFEHAEVALKEHYNAMKKSMNKLQKSHTTLQRDQAKVELEKVFLNANGAILITQAYSEEISSLTGVSKKELDTFFADLTHDISGLHKALDKSEHKFDDFRLFFAELLARISKLQISSENSKAKSREVTAFFTNLIQMISNLERALERPNQKPAEHEAELRAFFKTLGTNVANLEAEMGKKGVIGNEAPSSEASP